MRRIGERLNAVTEIENVARTVAVARQHFGDVLANALRGCIQGARVEIALNCHVLADAAARIADPAVKDRLRRNAEEAVARGVFGVPTFVIADELFWGEDVTGMMLDYLADPELFKRGDLARLDDLPIASERKQSRLG